MAIAVRKKNAFYAQSGGVTAVINASACGVIETARKHKDKIGKVFAGRNGIIGALTEDLIDTSKESARAIAALRQTPSGAFGSCRYKMKSLEANKREYDRLIEVFAAHNIGYFFYNGGGDSADTCLKVSQLSKATGYPIQAIHIPKTVDNDLPITDNCPGFGSVAKYIAVSTREASFDVASMCATSTKVFVLEVMGRHAGWIAAAGGMASSEDCDLPIIILFPEVPFNQTKFLTEVKAKVKKYGYVSIVVSEGVADSKGKFLADQGLKDAFGHAHRHRQYGAQQTGLQVPLGRGGLPAACSTSYRVQIRCRTGLCPGQGRGRAGSGRQELGHADRGTHVQQAVPLEDW